MFTSDGTSTVYTINEAVNGAYGGSVGIGLFDSEQNRESTLIGKPGIPHSYPQLIFSVAPAAGEIVALVGTPIPSPGNAYTAEYYDVDLVCVQPKQRKIVSLGKKELQSLDAAFQVGTDGRVLIFSEYWKRYSQATEESLPDAAPHNSRRRSVYSPDLKYYLCAQPEDEPDHFVLYGTADGKRLATLPKMVLAFEAVWSSDSKRFAFVGLPRGVGAMHHSEQLAVYSVP